MFIKQIFKMAFKKEMSLTERKKKLESSLEDFKKLGNINPKIVEKYKKQLEEVEVEIQDIKFKGVFWR